MEKNPLISIIIPNFNRAHLISETLESIRNQTYKHWECIVVDDHSTDNSWAIVMAFCEIDERFRQVKRPDNYKKGACSCRNYGFEISKGTYINWFDSDDIMLPQKLKEQILAAEKNKSDLVVCQTQFFEETITNLKHFWNKTFTSTFDPLTDFITFRLAWSTNAPLWKKSFLNGKLLFNESLKSSQDWEFHVKMLSYNPRFTKLDDALVLNRMHPQRIGVLNSSSNKINRLETRIIAFNELKKKDILNEEIKKYFQSFFINQFKYIANEETYIPEKVISLIKECSHSISWKFKIYPAIWCYMVIFNLFGKKHLTFKYLLKQVVNDNRK